MLKHSWMGNRLLELHVKSCLPEMVLPNRRGVPSAIHGTFKLARPDAAKGSSGGNSTFNDLVALPYRKAVLTPAYMIDLLVPFSNFVIALDITVRMTIKHGVPAKNSPRNIEQLLHGLCTWPRIGWIWELSSPKPWHSKCESSCPIVVVFMLGDMTLTC